MHSCTASSFYVSGINDNRKLNRREEAVKPGCQELGKVRPRWQELLGVSKSPALKRMSGEVEEKKVLDIGYGEDSFSSFFGEKCASQIRK